MTGAPPSVDNIEAAIRYVQNRYGGSPGRRYEAGAGLPRPVPTLNVN